MFRADQSFAGRFYIRLLHCNVSTNFVMFPCHVVVTVWLVIGSRSSTRWSIFFVVDYRFANGLSWRTVQTALNGGCRQGTNGCSLMNHTHLSMLYLPRHKASSACCGHWTLRHKNWCAHWLSEECRYSYETWLFLLLANDPLILCWVVLRSCCLIIARVSCSE